MKAQEIKNILIVKILKLDLTFDDLAEAHFTFKHRSTKSLAELFIFLLKNTNFASHYKDIFIMADCKVKAEALVKEIKKGKKGE